jgi:hypothetical protein
MPFEMIDTNYSVHEQVFDFEAYIKSAVMPKVAGFSMDDAYSDKCVYEFIKGMIPKLFSFYPDERAVLILFNRIEIADRLPKWDWKCFDNKVELLVEHGLTQVAFKVNR